MKAKQTKNSIIFHLTVEKTEGQIDMYHRDYQLDKLISICRNHATYIEDSNERMHRGMHFDKSFINVILELETSLEKLVEYEFTHNNGVAGLLSQIGGKLSRKLPGILKGLSSIAREHGLLFVTNTGGAYVGGTYGELKYDEYSDLYKKANPEALDIFDFIETFDDPEVIDAKRELLSNAIKGINLIVQQLQKMISRKEEKFLRQYCFDKFFCSGKTVIELNV